MSELERIAHMCMDELDKRGIPAEYQFEYMHCTITTDDGAFSFEYDEPEESVIKRLEILF